MGQTNSSEANGMKCIECGKGLPPNNWEFHHSGQDGWVYVLYKQVHGPVTVTNSVNAGASIGNDGPNATVNASQTEQRTDCKVIQYIRNATKENGYTCLRCVSICCQPGYPGWDRVVREINRVMVSNSIFVIAEQRFDAVGHPFMFLSVAE